MVPEQASCRQAAPWVWPRPAAAEVADPYAAVSLHFGDATLGGAIHFTHVYAFDRVFSPHTMRAVAAILMRSPFYVFVSYRPCAEWWAHGLRCVQPVAKMNMKTTGKETMNVYVYVLMHVNL